MDRTIILDTFIRSDVVNYFSLLLSLRRQLIIHFHLHSPCHDLLLLRKKNQEYKVSISFNPISKYLFFIT